MFLSTLPFHCLSESVHPGETKKLALEEKSHTIVFWGPSQNYTPRRGTAQLLSQLFSLARTTPVCQSNQAIVSPQSSCVTDMLGFNCEMLCKLLYRTCWNEMCSQSGHTAILLYECTQVLYLSMTKTSLLLSGAFCGPVSGTGPSIVVDILHHGSLFQECRYLVHKICSIENCDTVNKVL